MKKTFDVKRLTTLALLTTIALTIFVVESAIPTLVPIPGVKLGLANIVTLFVLKRYKFSDVAIVLAMRIILATIFTGQAVSFIYSVSGGFLCLIVMAAVINCLRDSKYSLQVYLVRCRTMQVRFLLHFSYSDCQVYLHICRFL